eukprot:scaffold2489_cov259-Pinguiococcus_pyrenoidosus.AAC.11
MGLVFRANVLQRHSAQLLGQVLVKADGLVQLGRGQAPQHLGSVGVLRFQHEGLVRPHGARRLSATGDERAESGGADRSSQAVRERTLER